MDSYVLQAIAIAAAVAGLLAPVLSALINRPTWSSQRKQAVALGVAVLLALLGLTFAGAFTIPIVDPAAIGLAILAVVGTSQAVYALLLKTTGLSSTLEALAVPEDVPLPTEPAARHRSGS